MAIKKGVKFHENGTAYIWYPWSREVKTLGGGLITAEAFNLQQARNAVRSYQSSVRH